MFRSLLLVSFAMLFVMPGCSKPEAQVVADSAEQEPAVEAEVVEEVLVVEPANQAGQIPAPADASEAKAAEEEQANTSPRPSLMLSLMLQPVNLAITSTMESVQGLAGELTSGGIPGMPRPAETTTNETSVESSDETTESEADPAAP